MDHSITQMNSTFDVRCSYQQPPVVYQAIPPLRCEYEPAVGERMSRLGPEVGARQEEISFFSITFRLCHGRGH